MKMMFLLLALIILPVTGNAENAELSNQYKNCMDRSGGVTSDMLNCIAAETNIQDKLLNEAYKAAYSKLNTTRAKQFKEAQRAWIKYRDANCSFYADPDGGTMATVISNDCVMSSTASRAKELKQLLEQLEQ